MTARPRAEWLTIAQVCAELQVSETEWGAWREAGDTPLHVVMPSGQLRVRAADVERWLDSRADDTPTEQVSEARTEPRTRTEPDPHGNPYAYGDDPAILGLLRPLPAWRRQHIRDVIDAAGDNGLSRTEIWALTSRGYTNRQLNHALAELLAGEAYEEFIVRTGAPGRPPIRYRRKPSHAAGDNASFAARADASPRAGRDASRSAVVEREGQR
jgi:hypothetical protein